jgi:hypothetical protein
MSQSLTTRVPRLAGEFFVIVIGVLVALGVDSWVKDRTDRTLEREYLERLLDDAQYDIREIAFIDSLGRVGLYAGTRLTASGGIDDLDGSLLVGLVLAAGAERQPDLSRGTYNELLSSGRIDLIQSSEVRVALAAYDRVILETQGVWTNMSPRLRNWALSRIPIPVWERRNSTCTGSDGTWMYRVPTVCEFDLQGWSVVELRGEIQQPEVQRSLLLATHRFRTGLEVTRQLSAVAEELIESLQVALSAS